MLLSLTTSSASPPPGPSRQTMAVRRRSVETREERLQRESVEHRMVAWRLPTSPTPTIHGSGLVIVSSVQTVLNQNK